jgi:cation transport regulator ChaC
MFTVAGQPRRPFFLEAIDCASPAAMRASPEMPGSMLALDRGGSCRAATRTWH